jgi:hypothetical protein
VTAYTFSAVAFVREHAEFLRKIRKVASSIRLERLFEMDQAGTKSRGCPAGGQPQGIELD